MGSGDREIAIYMKVVNRTRSGMGSVKNGFDGMTHGMDRGWKKLTRGMKTALQAVGRTFNKVAAGVVARAKAMANGIKVAILAAAAAGVFFLYKSLEKAGNQQRGIRLLEAAVASTGYAARLSAQELVDMAAELQKVSRFGDEKIMRTQALLLTFTNIAGEQFRAVTLASMDLATSLGTDMKGAAIQLGKALNDPVTNLTALVDAGIQFTKQQKEVINALWLSGKQAEAQTIILAELNRQFGGQAAADAQTYLGKMDQLKNVFGDVQELIGGALIPIVVALSDKIRVMLEQNQSRIGEFFQGMVEKGIRGTGSVVKGFIHMKSGLDSFSANLGIFVIGFRQHIDHVQLALSKFQQQIQLLAGAMRLIAEGIMNPLKAMGNAEAVKVIMSAIDHVGEAEQRIQDLKDAFYLSAQEALAGMAEAEKATAAGLISGIDARVAEALVLYRAAAAAALAVSQMAPMLPGQQGPRALGQGIVRGPAPVGSDSIGPQVPEGWSKADEDEWMKVYKQTEKMMVQIQKIRTMSDDLADALKSTFSTAWESIIDTSLTGAEKWSAMFSSLKQNAWKAIGETVKRQIWGEKITTAVVAQSEVAKTSAKAAGVGTRLSLIATEIAADLKAGVVAIWNATANFFKATAAIPFIGPALALGSIAVMYKALSAAKKQVFHDGGWVGGAPSGGEVDARLRRREFVVNESAAAQWAPLLEQINRGGDIPQYAGAFNPRQAGAAGNRTVQINIPRGSVLFARDKHSIREIAREFFELSEAEFRPSFQE